MCDVWGLGWEAGERSLDGVFFLGGWGIGDQFVDGGVVHGFIIPCLVVTLHGEVAREKSGVDGVI